MKTTARNRLAGVVERVLPGSVNAEVILKSSGGSTISATVTMDAINELGIDRGKNITAIFKASSVILAKENQNLAISARNRISGSVIKIIEGMVNSEVVLKTEGGDEISAIITKEAAEELAIKTGDSLLAIVKASSVILILED